MNRRAAVLAAVVVALVGSLTTPASADDRGTYTNAVSRGFADTFADPAIMRAPDGWWYAVGTTDPLREGEGTRHLAPIARSKNLVDWSHVGDAFTEDSLPTWADADDGASIWAADLRYVDGQYRMYYVVTQTTVTPERDDNAIGVATAPTPAGPWTDSGAPVVGPRRGPSGEPGDFLWTYDPHHVRDDDGTQRLFYGSYYGGVESTRLDATGTRAVGGPTPITVGDTYEGSYVVRRDGWWYFMGSSANCCAGPSTGYAVRVARSRSIDGPFLDRDGRSLLDPRTGGTPLLAQNGNRWIGTGHHAVVQDLAGQDWIAYHAIDRADPYLDGTDGINERPMLVDRLDWSDGWPVVRGGRGPSDTPQTAPVASGARGFDGGRVDGDGWTARGRWSVRDSAAVAGGRGEITRRVPSARVRVEADVRPVGADTGVVTGLRGGGSARATVTADGTLTLTVRDRRGRVVRRDQDAPGASFDPRDWHALSLQVAGGRAVAELSDARLGDPVATADLRSAGASGRAGATAGARGASVDDLSVVRAAVPRRAVPAAGPGRVDRSLGDEFDGALSPRWQRVRDPQVRVEDGSLVWPVQQADLSGPGGDAALMLQEPPRGDWTVETVVDTGELGDDELRNFAQGGLLVHADDDRWVRLSTVAIQRTRQNELGSETPYAGRVVSGGSIGGPAGERTWLRVTRRADPRTGELRLTGSTSLDGRTWRTGATWTMPTGTRPRVGLFAGGAVDPVDADVRFSYLRWYRR